MLAASGMLNGAVGLYVFARGWLAMERAPGMGEVMGALLAMAVAIATIATAAGALALRARLPHMRGGRAVGWVAAMLVLCAVPWWVLPGFL